MSAPSAAQASSDSEADPEKLLAAAQHGDAERLGQLLQRYQNYLTILATTQLDARLRQRISPSDLVQEAMLGAYRDFPRFRGQSERELLAWLRQILINCLCHAYESHVKAKRRDVRRDVSLDEARRVLDHSVARLAQALADKGPSPSAHAHQRERAVAMANQLAKLRPAYRDVIVLRNLQDLSFDEIAERLERKPGAVRMLWLRAVEKLREVYDQDE